MESAFFHRLGSVLWRVLVLLLVALAIYVSAGRLLMANLERWQVDVLQVVNSNVPFIVEAGRVSGQWRGFAPEIILSDLRLSFLSSAENPSNGICQSRRKMTHSLAGVAT